MRNYTRLNLNGYSFVIMGILGIYTILSLSASVKISASITLLFKDRTSGLVPLHNFGA